MPRHRRVTPTVLATAGLALTLTACTVAAGTPPAAEPSDTGVLTSVDAIPTYDAVKNAVTTSLGDVVGNLWKDPLMGSPTYAELPDGRCLLAIADAGATYVGGSSSELFESVPSLLAPELVERGFSVPSGVEEGDDGALVVRAEDERRWTVTVTLRGDTVRVAVAGEVSNSPCADPTP